MHMPLLSFLQLAKTDAFANPTSNGQGRPSQSVEDNYLDGAALLPMMDIQSPVRTPGSSRPRRLAHRSGPNSCPCVGGASKFRRQRLFL